MAASSVTGVSGPGMSHGFWKPENNSGCGCNKCGKPIESTPVKKPVCFTATASCQCSSITVGQNTRTRACN